MNHNDHSPRKCCANLSALCNEQRGMALVLTLTMLAILSVLGAYALSTSNTELGVTSNFRGGRESFMAADRILEYAKGVVVTDEPEATVFLTSGDHPLNIESFGHGAMYTGSGEANEITYLTDGSGPAAYYGKKDANDVLGIYFRVSTTGQGSNQRSLTRLESTFFAVTKVGTADDGNYSD